ncbi:uncharacterized protein METZ01_LOCUS133266 [marine metagenome]|uniref:Calcineurin-like phosphoesterase domain-containing protein n=1 Tax=marine metagenome TaxID=408172 RepID=A0A381YUY3_9ZZZZ
MKLQKTNMTGGDSFTETVYRVFFILIFIALVFTTPKLSSLQSSDIENKERQEEVFCFVGDTGEVTDVQRSVARALESSDCKSVWLTGDIIYPSGISSSKDPEFKEKFLNPFKGVLLKEVPFYFTLGNHDHKKSPSAYMDIAKSNSLINFPNFYYAESFHDICFIALDTTIFDKLYMYKGRKSQISWLESEKKSLREKCRFSVVVGHHPLFSSGKRKKGSPQLSLFLKNHIFGSFDIYVAGHNHVLADEGELEGTLQLISGTGSLPGGSSKEDLKGKFNKENPGFLKLSITEKENNLIGNYEFIDANSLESIWQNSKVGSGIRTPN